MGRWEENQEFARPGAKSRSERQGEVTCAGSGRLDQRTDMSSGFGSGGLRDELVG